MAFCIPCSDFVAPFRAWQTNRAWRWCQCGEAGVRWRNGEAGLLEVTNRRDDRGAVRVIGIANTFLEAAILQPNRQPNGWRDLHQAVTEQVGSHYLFHAAQRACWVVVLRPGESRDAAFVSYAEAAGVVQNEVP